MTTNPHLTEAEEREINEILNIAHFVKTASFVEKYGPALFDKISRLLSERERKVREEVIAEIDKRYGDLEEVPAYLVYSVGKTLSEYLREDGYIPAERSDQ